MKFKLFLALLLLVVFQSTGQLNITELGSLDLNSAHSTGLNDIWGYTDEFGNEYALVGAEDGVSIVDISDPTEPNEIFWTEGLNSVWRDLKTWGDYAYITTEALQGLMIIDLSGLPGDTDLPVTFYTGEEDATWQSAHNLYQADGYLYIFGANRENGGVIILDVATDPLNPTEVGVFDNWYVHDGFVADDIGYFGHIYEGFFSIVDLTDKSDPVLLGTAITPTLFTHNIWVSEDGNYAYTTDEVSGGFIGSFDISDPGAIQLLDQIQSSPGDGIVPHNSHVKGNYLYTSYYTDGVVVHDITHPHNMIEIGNFDTSPFDTPFTQGCWGVYPYFESGVIIATDRQEGLFVLDVEEKQASYLEGVVTEAETGLPLNNVEISIAGAATTDFSNVLGDYATGTEAEGTFEVTYFKASYLPQVVEITFENGEIVEQDIALEKVPEFDLNIRVFDSETMEAIPDVMIMLEHSFITTEVSTNPFFGHVTVPLYYEDQYQVRIGKWGYQTVCFTDTLLTSETEELVVYMEPGFEDDFIFDFGWNATATASRGHWEREIPVGVMREDGTIENPFEDDIHDCGSKAWLTGNGSTLSGDQEVNNGKVLLISPYFDLTGAENPHINFSTWFYCDNEDLPSDTMEVSLLNGEGSSILIAKFFRGGLPMSQWNPVSIDVTGKIALTSTMRVLVELSDLPDTESITEGGLDHFSVTDFSIAGVTEKSAEKSNISLYPNPFNETLNLTGITNGNISIYDLSGRMITKIPVANSIDVSSLDKGTYIFVVENNVGEVLETFRQIKF